MSGSAQIACKPAICKLLMAHLYEIHTLLIMEPANLQIRLEQQQTHRKKNIYIKSERRASARSCTKCCMY